MTDSVQTATHALTERSRELTAGLGLGTGALGAVLLNLVERLDALFSIKDVPSGRYLHANARLASLYGYTLQDLFGRTDADLLGPELSASLRAADLAAVSNDGVYTCDHRFGREPARREFEVTRVCFPAVDGAPQRLCSVWIERTQARQLSSKLARALQQIEQQQTASESLFSELQEAAAPAGAAGPYQRGQFEDQLRREIDLSAREHREFAVVAITIDPLPDQAAALGDAARRRVVESLGILLRGNTRAMDASCRLDEDHFAILLSGVGLATAHSRMEGLRRQCATQIVVLDGRDMGFSVSMGIASFPHTAHTQEELMEAADKALLEARRRGGNHVALASIPFER